MTDLYLRKDGKKALCRMRQNQKLIFYVITINQEDVAFM